MREENRGPWYLLTGLIIGVAFGLLYSWVISPVKYVDTAPKSLRGDYKEGYRLLVAAAYLANGDLQRARARLELMGDADIVQALSIQAGQAISLGRPESETRPLSLLSIAMGQGTSPVTASPEARDTPSPLPPQAETGTPTATTQVEETLETAQTTSTTPLTRTPSITPKASFTASPSFTPLPTRTVTPTPGPAFRLQEQALVCELTLSQPLIQVDARDAAGNPVPGVEFVVSWDGQSQHFFTGLKPELGLGYADFVMSPGQTYLLGVADEPDLIELTPMECESETGERSWGAWKLTFVQP